MDLQESSLIYAPVSGPCRPWGGEGRGWSHLHLLLQPRWDWAGCGGDFSVLFQPSAENLGYFALLLSAGVWAKCIYLVRPECQRGAVPCWGLTRWGKGFGVMLAVMLSPSIPAPLTSQEPVTLAVAGLVHP